MPVPALLHDLLLRTPPAWVSRPALTPGVGSLSLTYGQLQEEVQRCAGAFSRLGLRRGARVAVYLEKRTEMVVACFGAAAAGLVMVPINPGLKPEQVRHVLMDSQAAAWVTSSPRLEACVQAGSAQGRSWWGDQDEGGDGGHGGTEPLLTHLRFVVCTDSTAASVNTQAGHPPGVETVPWGAFMQLPPALSPSISPSVLDTDLAALLYTSGSTGRPKGVMLSHRNLVVGARSVAEYLENHEQDALLAVLPLSFDAGFSQLTTAFTVGARAVLINHLLPQDVVKALQRERITGLTAVPPLYHQMIQSPWPKGLDEHLRYFASTGGAMPTRTLQALRERLPRAQPFIMYGLTEAFRSTYLPPHEVDRRPGSMGRAIPNVEVLVLRPDGTECVAGEEGELVHRGPLVGLGYWRDPVRTAHRFRPLPVGLAGREVGHVLHEFVVYSGDRVKRDEDGFLYHLGRQDEQIKTSGYRVSPGEVEEVLMQHPTVSECVVFGVPDEALGQRIAVVISPAPQAPMDEEALRAHCRRLLPAHMVPAHWLLRAVLPRNANGKIDRVSVVQEALPEVREVRGVRDRPNGGAGTRLPAEGGAS